MAEFKVLFIDDDHVTRETFARCMRWQGIHVDSVATPLEAKALMGRAPYPVVVSDYALGDCNGLSVIEQLHRLYPTTTFVLITGTELNLPQSPVADQVTFALLEKPWEDDQTAEVLRRARALHDEKNSHDTLVAGAPLTVLLVEDNPGDADLAQAALEGQEVSRFHHATRLSDALDLLRKEQFRVIITDLTLPDARGLDAVSRLRTAAPDSAIVVTSGLPGEVERQALRMGAQEFIDKGSLNARMLKRALVAALERKDTERRLAALAGKDPLTGLANRSVLEERLSQALSKYRRSGEKCAMCFIDLDGFKPINDTWGHQTGDEVLLQIAARLSAQVREYDLVARLGGDEFAVLLNEVPNSTCAVDAAIRINKALCEPMQFGDRRLTVGASIGVALSTPRTQLPSTLLDAADRAMYSAKRNGKNTVVLSHEAEG